MIWKGYRIVQLQDVMIPFAASPTLAEKKNKLSVYKALLVASDNATKGNQDCRSVGCSRHGISLAGV
ncbi:hypothetical protein M758_10G160700 [Ceratodon purpureus]|uniref:Uncharacterized protein n=1 Tax=Ceratodon purpureus TaxID=3225 RepID=A0A8T0GMR9_CERPU|nr:hypothetical protein KC19_10G165500 [Ceratodon purpureus]KAG0604302.1 hypothetical protein M758_10G160700 [Ceratodon purpureus]